MKTVDVSKLADMRMECACGRSHAVPIRHILTGEGALDGLSGILRPFRGKRVFVTGDQNTMPLARDVVTGQLLEAGCEVSEHVFAGERRLVLDERLIGAMLIRLPPRTDLIVTIGSGTLNDLSRVVAARCGIPWIIIGTAPSMDGYASAVSPVVMEGGKHSIPLGVPYAVLADTGLLRTAPDEMISSGVGDILGKYVALCDWQLARRETGEYYCDFIADMIHTAAHRCVQGLERVRSRDHEALRDMADTLVMSGVAISMHGLSRPASGSEHQLAHYWEVALLGGERDAPLHGNFVGLGTQAACRLYELAAREFDLGFPYFPPKAALVKEYMDSLGSFAAIETLGVTRALFFESFFHATESNGRYTLLTYLEQKGRLAHYANLLADEFFS